MAQSAHFGTGRLSDHTGTQAKSTALHGFNWSKPQRRVCLRRRRKELVIRHARWTDLRGSVDSREHAQRYQHGLALTEVASQARNCCAGFRQGCICAFRRRAHSISDEVPSSAARDPEHAVNQQISAPCASCQRRASAHLIHTSARLFSKAPSSLRSDRHPYHGRRDSAKIVAKSCARER